MSSNGDYKSGYFYDADRDHPILVEIGAHGIGAVYAEKDEEFLSVAYGEGAKAGDKTEPFYLPDGQSIPVPSFGATRQHSDEAQATSSLRTQPLVEFIYMGRSHRYLADDFPRLAPFYRDRLFAEARLLVRSIQGDQAIAYEFLEGDPSLGAWMTHSMRKVIDVFRSDPIPKPEDFDRPMNMVFEAWRELKQAPVEDYATIHRTGITFMKARWEADRLSAAVQRRIQSLIETAEWGEKGAREIEGASFTVLDLYGQVRYAKSPAQLAAYRCGILLIRAGANYIGNVTADNSQRKAVQESLGVVRKQFPTIATDLFIGYIKVGMGSPKKLDVPQELAVQLISLELFILFETLDYFIFVAPDLPPGKKGDANKLFLEQFAPKFVEELLKSMVSIGFATQSGVPADSKKAKWLEIISTVLGALITSVMAEYTAAKSTANAEKKPVLDVILSDLGWCILRILKNVGLALAKEAGKGAMQSKFQSDQTSGVKSFRLDKNELKARILSFYLKVSEINPDFVSPPPPPSEIIAPAGPTGEPPPGLEPKPEQPIPKPPNVGIAKDGISVGMNKSAPFPIIDENPPPRPRQGDKAPAKAKPLDRKKNKTKAQIPPYKPKQVKAPRPRPNQDLKARLKDPDYHIRVRAESEHFELQAGQIPASRGYKVLATNDDDLRPMLGISKGAPCADFVGQMSPPDTRRVFIGDAKGTDISKGVEQLKATWDHLQTPAARERLNSHGKLEPEFFLFIRPGTRPVIGDGAYIENGILMKDGQQVRIGNKPINIVEVVDPES